MEKAKSFKFTCGCCGQIHEGSPSFAYDGPAFIRGMNADEKEERVEQSSDLCVVHPSSDQPSDQKVFFIRTVLEVPIHGTIEPFTWGVWVSQSEQAFRKYSESFGVDQTGEVSFGWLAVNLPHYDRSQPGEYLENLACDVIWSDVGQRPKLEIQECDHQLFIDQRDGITWDKAAMIAELAMHGRL